MTFGKAHSERYGKRSKEDAFQILDHLGEWMTERKDPDDIVLANEYARNNIPRPFSVCKGMEDAGMRDFERSIIPMCHQQGMMLCPYSVLGQGRPQTEEGYKEENNDDGRNFIPLSDHDKKVFGVLDQVANSKGCELLQVALAYVQLTKPGSK
ncbi:sterigmatocystin biosynthesis dehydrogenase stcV [Stemphylium lycopersici]|uniref:Sterigmatocystin biosynthesis dehydrogenase stcV n=1 Tax=Stemphylium lycopersici TaxID=183478 RepID=A0A364MVA1_STELY|nr:hypothetical protein TW65_01232 [Stemphylium lycopersici]RAR04267.1 sterigmatocystin biosynthesis dehydrogenase stcV [Stemphylium lycopersici]RAR05610.1 sterigmatocystin biosynthesis dehydrogenase stcV [Stemphylium lycopersici]